MNRLWLYILGALLVALLTARFFSPTICSFVETYGHAPKSTVAELEQMPLAWRMVYTVYDAVVVFFGACLFAIGCECK
jgi:putative exporter of polyketide antibiotics